MKFNSDFGPKSLDKIIDKLVEKHGWGDQIVLEKIPEIWNEAVGEKIAAVTKIKRFEDGKLFIETASSTWKTEISLRREQLIENLNKKLGANLIEKLVLS